MFFFFLIQEQITNYTRLLNLTGHRSVQSSGDLLREALHSRHFIPGGTHFTSLKALRHIITGLHTKLHVEEFPLIAPPPPLPPKKLLKPSPTARVPTAFLVLPSFRSCLSLKLDRNTVYVFYFLSNIFYISRVREINYLKERDKRKKRT